MDAGTWVLRVSGRHLSCPSLKQQPERIWMSEVLTRKDFAVHLHTIFKVETPAALELELEEIQDRSNARLEQFSVIFTGPMSPWLPQRTYTLLHPEMHQVALVLVPLGPPAARMVYEAAFTRFSA